MFCFFLLIHPDLYRRFSSAFEKDDTARSGWLTSKKNNTTQPDLHHPFHLYMGAHVYGEPLAVWSCHVCRVCMFSVGWVVLEGDFVVPLVIMPNKVIHSFIYLPICISAENNLYELDHIYSQNNDWKTARLDEDSGLFSHDAKKMQKIVRKTEKDRPEAQYSKPGNLGVTMFP